MVLGQGGLVCSGTTRKPEWVEECEAEKWEIGFGEAAGSPDITTLEACVRTLLIKSERGHHCEGIEPRSDKI